MLLKTLVTILTSTSCVSAHGFIEKIFTNANSWDGYNPTNAP